jgi:hypothetical protein
VTLISYCSNERNLARALLCNAVSFSDAVFVSVGDKLYNGEPEDDAHVAALSAEFPTVRFVRYTVDLSMPPIAMHNAARIAGVKTAATAFGEDSRDFWTLLLDGDEVPEGPRFSAWWAATSAALDRRDAFKLLNHWMFLSPRLVARVHEDSPLLVHASFLFAPNALTHPRERDGVHILGTAVGGGGMRLRRNVGGLDGEPMIWHYSWVRADRRSLHKKVENWGHRDDRDWTKLIDDAIDGLERGEHPERDFVHGYPLRLLSVPGGFGWEDDPPPPPLTSTHPTQ